MSDEINKTEVLFVSKSDCYILCICFVIKRDKDVTPDICSATIERVLFFPKPNKYTMR